MALQEDGTYFSDATAEAYRFSGRALVSIETGSKHRLTGTFRLPSGERIQDVYKQADPRLDKYITTVHLATRKTSCITFQLPSSWSKVGTTAPQAVVETSSKDNLQQHDSTSKQPLSLVQGSFSVPPSEQAKAQTTKPAGRGQSDQVSTCSMRQELQPAYLIIWDDRSQPERKNSKGWSRKLIPASLCTWLASLGSLLRRAF